MGLDGIGRRGAPVTCAAHAERAAAKPFPSPSEVRAAAPPARPSLATSAGRTPLDRLRTGEVDREGYLDLKVDEAVAHLEGLPPEELDAIRAALRGQLASESVLIQLVNRVEGKEGR